MTRVSLLSLSTLICLLAPDWSSLVHADSQTCARVAEDVVIADGVIDDWSGIGRRSVGGTERDASFTIRCAYDDKRLHLAVEARDDFMYRGKKPSTRKDDHLLVELKISGKKSDRLVLFPANDQVARTRRWNGRKVPAWLEVEDAQIRRGWAMELSMPLTRIRGYNQNAGAIIARIQLNDADYAAKIEGRVTFDGQLTLEGADALYQAFLASTKLSPEDITLDTMANVDDSPGAERIVAGGDLIGIIGDQFFYMTLPVAAGKDVAKVQVVDLRGDGTKSILTQVRQHGNGGSRDLLIVWHAGSNQLQQVLAWEIRKEKAGKVLENRWSLAPRGKYRTGRSAKRGRDLVLEVSDKDARGWDEDNYFEQPAQDAQPILTPWSDQTSAVYYLDGNSAQGGDPKKRGKKRRRK